ncbi:MAG: hypothetical protein ACJ72G_07025 [Friedmanniella sp.]
MSVVRHEDDLSLEARGRRGTTSLAASGTLTGWPEHDRSFWAITGPPVRFY